MVDGVVFLTIGEVAEYLKVSRETLYKLVRSGRIPASKVGKHWRFSRGEIDHWVGLQRDRRSLPRLKVLVADEQPAAQKALAGWLSEARCDVRCATHERELLGELKASRFDLIILDPLTPGLNGFALLQDIRILSPTTILVLATDFFDIRLMAEALELGPFMAMKKPITQQTISTLVNSLVACGRRSLEERAHGQPS